MALYEYECKNCGRLTASFAPMELRDRPILCECGENASRILSTANINAQHWLYNDENRRAFAEMSDRETQKKEDNEYEKKRQFASSPVSHPDAGKSLTELYHQDWGTAI